MEGQSLSVKRAEVEFHQFASLGEPELAIAAYKDENVRRGAILREYLDWVGPMTPFLEIGANAGHSSYMLANEFGADGFALDLSADSLRHGKVLMREWGLDRAPVRIAGDALHLPFADGSLRMVMAFQMLSQFMDIEAVIVEVKRVLAPGGVFFFAEEPVRRLLSLHLYRAPYERDMRPWERLLHRWGLLGYLTSDVIGADQEESFGIRQNHATTLNMWHALIHKHFIDEHHRLYVAERGWGEMIVRRLARKLDRLESDWLPTKLLGGTIAALCRKEGQAGPQPAPDLISLLRCPDCQGPLRKATEAALVCSDCGYAASDEDGVYNLLSTALRSELYPGDRPDIIDFSQAPHEERLISGFSTLEGSHGALYRWIGAEAAARLERIEEGEHHLRVRGFASQQWFAQQGKPEIRLVVNGVPAGAWTMERPGLFVLETPLPAASSYVVEIHATPVYQVPDDERTLSVSIGMLRLVRA